jgi:ribosomal protein L11 methyltransferase
LIRLGIRVRAADADIAFDRLEPVLAAGAEEVELDDLVEFAVYGETVPTDDEVRALAGDAVISVVRSRVDSGWALAWQEHLVAVTVGAFTIRPPWLEGDGDDLVIDPGPSFGAASHPTTRLCLALLAETTPTALADWGTGSGVLAIAAARLGFAPVVALELDILAAHVARRNAGRNGVVVEVLEGDVTVDAPWAPTIVANLTLPLLVAAAAGATALRPDPRAKSLGTAERVSATSPVRLIASGVLARAADEVVAAWGPLGFSEVERRELDGWAALVLERSA